MASTNGSFRLSVLDQSPIAEGSTPGDALRNSIELARLAESLGYHRFWLAEHHGTPGLACAAPEVVIGPIAQATSRIRVGSGGIMLPHYSPLKVAETFSMLSELYPGRIDLGVGRASGTSPTFSYALQRDRRQPSPDDFREQFAELLGYLGRAKASAGPFPQFAPAFASLQRPEPWLLGSSLQSAIWAAELGLPYVFADFINADGAQIAEHYRSHFQPSANLKTPTVLVAAWVICADTDAEALRLSASFRMMMTMLYRGRLIAVPPVERALHFLREDGTPLETMPAGRRMITGAPATVRAKMESLAREYEAEEILMVNIMFDNVQRRRSYELVAEAFF